MKLTNRLSGAAFYANKYTLMKNLVSFAYELPHDFDRDFTLKYCL